MLDDQPYFGFDASADGGLTVVMMRRTENGRWQVENVDGPDNEDLSRVVARIAGDHAPAEPEWVCEDCGYHNTGGICTHCGRPRNKQPWADLVAAWMDRHQGTTFQLTAEQRRIVQATFERLTAEGKIRL